MRFVAVCLRRICGTFGAREDPLVLSCSRHAPVNSTGVISVMLDQETRALTRNHPITFRDRWLHPAGGVEYSLLVGHPFA
jgi:hypothetical protein